MGEFTKQARETATKAREHATQERIANRYNLEVFVVRAGAAILYCWEVRQFGGVLVGRSDATFTSIEQARSAGLQYLDSLGGGKRSAYVNSSAAQLPQNQADSGGGQEHDPI